MKTFGQRDCEVLQRWREVGGGDLDSAIRCSVPKQRERHTVQSQTCVHNIGGKRAFSGKSYTTSCSKTVSKSSGGRVSMVEEGIQEM